MPVKSWVQCKRKHRQAVRTALNKTAREAKKQDERITKQTYTAKGDIHSLQFKKATTANLQAILKDKGSNISMSHFRTYVGKKRISAVINTKHGRRNLGKYGNKAFFWNTIFVREGQSRLPIEKWHLYHLRLCTVTIILGEQSKMM